MTRKPLTIEVTQEMAEEFLAAAKAVKRDAEGWRAEALAPIGEISSNEALSPEVVAAAQAAAPEMALQQAALCDAASITLRRIYDSFVMRGPAALEAL